MVASCAEVIIRSTMREGGRILVDQKGKISLILSRTILAGPETMGRNETQEAAILRMVTNLGVTNVEVEVDQLQDENLPSGTGLDMKVTGRSNLPGLGNRESTLIAALASLIEGRHIHKPI